MAKRKRLPRAAEIIAELEMDSDNLKDLTVTEYSSNILEVGKDADGNFQAIAYNITFEQSNGNKVYIEATKKNYFPF